MERSAPRELAADHLSQIDTFRQAVDIADEIEIPLRMLEICLSGAEHYIATPTTLA